MRNHTDSDSDRALDRALEAAGNVVSFEHTVVLERDWLPSADTVTLDVSYRIGRDEAGARISARVDGHELPLDEPLRLAAAEVPKPWGRELWLTGIEARGESGVCTGAGVLPLSRYLALAPRRLTGGKPLVLLKVLDPRPEPVLGDLYFEVHEHKQEVYVVTHVDPTAWPRGRGAIRYGMNQTMRRQYRDDAAFRRDYLAAVKRYETVRRAIDEGTATAGREEAALRRAMEAFTHLRELAVGDVVRVPVWLPHSLQHGVRVVEFQTPAYERQVISFAQKVLTQSHWDSETAIPRMRLDVPEPPAFEVVAEGAERVAEFDDFNVWRVALQPGEDFRLPVHPSYLLGMVVCGRVTIASLSLTAEEAAFVPRLALDGACCERPLHLVNPGVERATVLLAAPDL